MKNEQETIFASEAMPHLKDLYRTALESCATPAAAEDIVQEVFLQAWKSFDELRAGNELPRVALSDYVFQNQSSPPNAAMQSKFFQIGRRRRHSVCPRRRREHRVAQHLTDEDVIAALDKFSANYRAVVLLADVEEFDYKQVAQILQIPIGTVMSRLSARAEAVARIARAGRARIRN